jgi:F-type H+-transporting ATPase subunit b
MPQLNPADFAPQLIWLGIVLAGLWALVQWWLAPAIGSVIDARNGRIEGDLAEARRLKDETQKAISDYEKALSDARAKAGALAQGERDRLKAEVDGERAKVEAQLGERLKAAEAQIKAAKDTAVGQVHDVAGETVETLVQELLGIKVHRDEAMAAVRAHVAN